MDTKDNKRILHPSAIKKDVVGAGVLIVFLLIMFVISSYIPKYALYITIGGSVIIIGATLVESTIYKKSNEIEIGKSSIAVKKGLLSVKSVVIPYVKITDMNIERPLLDRLLGLGVLEINTAGSEEMEAMFPDIKIGHLREIVKTFRERGAGVSSDVKE